MSRIFLTGDTHRLMDTVKIDTFDRKIGHELNSDDYLIIVGDFGGIWTGVDIPKSSKARQQGRHHPYSLRT